LYYVIGSASWGIFVSTWDSSINDWGMPQNVGPPVNTSDGAEFSARLSPDGSKLYFSSDGEGRCGIYRSDWNGTSWSAPERQWGCGTPDYPSVSANGLWFYFDAFVPDGQSIFVTSWKDSAWGFPAIDLRPEIGGRAVTPFVSSTGDTLFFGGSPDLGGFGSLDIWLSKRLLPGDLNLDSQLTTADVVLELNKVFLDQPYPAPPRLGDLNCDTVYSPADAVLILLFVFGMVTSLDC
jgi:hypothetical protein